jgi:hypothetical protein
VVIDFHNGEDEEDGVGDGNEEEDGAATTEIEKEDGNTGADKAAYGVKQKLIQNISFNLLENSDSECEKREKKKFVKSRTSLVER